MAPSATSPDAIDDLFGRQIPAAFLKSPREAASIGQVFQIEITRGVGSVSRWHIDCRSLPPTCTPGAGTRKADSTVRMTDKDFLDLAKDPKSRVMALFFAGKIKIDGDPIVTMKIGKILDLLPKR